MRTLAFLLFALLSAHAFAASWHCRNEEMEIRCSADKCAASDSFTPLDIALDANGGLSVCAYSGCWEGVGKVTRSEKNLLVSGMNLEWTGNTPGRDDFIVAIDTGDKAGFIKGAGFAMPIRCEMRNR